MNRRKFLTSAGIAGLLSLIPTSFLKFIKPQLSWWNDNIEPIRIGSNSEWGRNLFVLEYNRLIGHALVNVSTEQWEATYMRVCESIAAAPNATAKDIELQILFQSNNDYALITTVGAVVDFGTGKKFRHHPRIGDLKASKAWPSYSPEHPLEARVAQYAKEMIFTRDYLKKNKVT